MMQVTQLNVTGMTCAACVEHVTKALQSVPGVQIAYVDLPTKSASVEGKNVIATSLVAALQEEGYDAEVVPTQDTAYAREKTESSDTVGTMGESSCSCRGPA